MAITFSADADRAAKTLASLQGEGHVSIKGDGFSREGIAIVVEVCAAQSAMIAKLIASTLRSYSCVSESSAALNW